MTNFLPSRGLQGYAGGVLAGGMSAALFAVAFMHAETMLIMLAYLSAFPLFLIGLGTGAGSGAVASFAGIIGLCAIRPFDFSMFYAVVYGVPAVVLTALALRQHQNADGKAVWYSEGNLLTAITLYPCVAFLVAYGIAMNHDGGLLAITKRVLTVSSAQFKDKLDPDTFAIFTSALDYMARVLPAVLGCSWMFVMLLSLVGAQSLLKQKNWNLRPSFRMQDIHIPAWLIFAAAATGLVAVFAPTPYNYIGTNLCAMLVVPFVFGGLAVVHAMAGTTKAKTVLLVLFYILISLVPWMTLLVAGLGAVDQWVDFRRRFASQSTKGRKI